MAEAEFEDLKRVVAAWPEADALRGDRALYLQVYAAKRHLADEILLESVHHTFVEHVLSGLVRPMAMMLVHHVDAQVQVHVARLARVDGSGMSRP